MSLLQASQAASFTAGVWTGAIGMTMLFVVRGLLYGQSPFRESRTG